MRPLGFPKSSHLLKRPDFRRVYDTGTRYSSRLLSAFLLDNRDETRPHAARVGFTVPKALGKAVVRNRIRRRTREAVRLDYAAIGPTWDIVIHPRRAALDAPFEELRREVRRLLAKCENQEKTDAIRRDPGASGV
jgi:ribonuclease P protein component